ncbi:hypothetical protein [Mesorhizobium sp.]|uniref:hypothetical protein n=1 Tax=Mesorhizobium sp. TaxID=1871066 RepID=UPI000FE5AF19|nr:hypothetical protein [Mesorhizobium sp.]RWN60197.1 MAG: hypothetical protein EOS00_16775 [Mesorhizobium sp.]
MIRTALTGSVLAWLVSLMSGEPAPEYFAVIVDGVEVGAGLDCVDAWDRARGHIPKGWREIRCEQVR